MCSKRIEETLFFFSPGKYNDKLFRWIKSLVPLKPMAELPLMLVEKGFGF